MMPNILQGFDEERNIAFEFFKDGMMSGREIRDEGIIKAHDGVKEVAEHLLSFYNERGSIDVNVFYKGKELKYVVVL